MSRIIRRFVAPTIDQTTAPLRGFVSNAQAAAALAQSRVSTALRPLNSLPERPAGAPTLPLSPQEQQITERADSGEYSAARFLSLFKNDVFRGNRFLIEMSLPPGISPDAIGGNRNAFTGNIQRIDRALNSNGRVSLKCHTATYPQRSLLTSEINQNSAAWRIPYSASYDPITFSFYADGHLDTRRYFELWQSASCNFSNNTMNFLSEYCSDVQMFVLDRQGNKQYHVTLIEAWVMNVGSFDVSYASQNIAQTITVTFAYKQWVPKFDTGGGAGAVS